MSNAKTARNLDSIMQKNGYWSADFYTFLPLEGKSKIIGNFEFKLIHDWRTKILVRYLGTDPKFQFINSFKERSSATDTVTWCCLTSYFKGPSKNKTYTTASFLSDLAYLYKNHVTKNWNAKVSFKDEPDIKILKKLVKEDKKVWEEARVKVIEETLGIPFSEYISEQTELANFHVTEFILKISPMLSSLRDECDSLLKSLPDSSGPSKQARESFYRAYKNIQGYHNHKTILYAIRTFDKKRKAKKR